MEYYIGAMKCSDEEILHYGRLGMKWGKHIFGKEESSSSPRHGGTKKTRKEIRADKKAKAARVKRLEAARKAKADKRTFEQQKAAALKSGNATDVLKFQGKITDKELNDALTRIRNENALKEISEKELKKDTTWDHLESLTKKMAIIKKNVETLSGLYNTVAPFLNTFYDTKLPQIQFGNQNNNNNKNNKNNKNNNNKNNKNNKNKNNK